jgi:hypothetical protein
MRRITDVGQFALVSLRNQGSCTLVWIIKARWIKEIGNKNQQRRLLQKGGLN